MNKTMNTLFYKVYDMSTCGLIFKLLTLPKSHTPAIMQSIFLNKQNQIKCLLSHNGALLDLIDKLVDISISVLRIH